MVMLQQFALFSFTSQALNNTTLKQGNGAKFFIFVTILVDVIGIGIIIPVVPELIQLLDGGNLSEASEIGGWLMFSFAIMQFVCAPILGGLSDRFGRKPVLLLSLFGLGLDYLFHAFAPTVFWLLVGRIIAGIFGASFTVATAYMADISKPEEKAKNFGLIGAAFGLGFIIGPAIGGIAAQWGVKMPFFIAAGLSLLNLLYGMFILPESLKQENRRPFDWKRANPVSSLVNLKQYPKILGLIMAFFLIHLAGKAVESVWSFYTMYRFDWDTAHVGYSLAVVGIMVSIVQGGLVGKIVNTFGQVKTIFIGYVFWVLGQFLFGIATEGWMMYSFIIVYCLGGVAGPTLQGIISNEVPDNAQGELQGALTSLISVTSIIGPLLFTSVFARFSGDEAPFHLPGASFFLGAFLAAISMLLAVRSLRRG